MIQTEVKKIGENEHKVHVTVAQEEYDRIYASVVNKLANSAKLPGFRPGKTPAHVLKQQFGPKLHEDTVSEILQEHYMTAIESSGLTPAAQPELDIPTVQPASGFEFTLNVVTWPEVKVKGLSKLKFDTTEVAVEEQDIQTVIERLQESQFRYEIEEGRAAEKGDQLHIDFTGYVDGEAFEGGKGEDVPLVLGEGRFIPGFEDQLVGAKAGDDVEVKVTFPEQYQAAHLAGKDAVFATAVRSVGKPETAADEDALATMLGFEDGKALRADAESRLTEEASEASFGATRDAALDALIEANSIELPEALVEQDTRETTQRVLQNMQRQGAQLPEGMLDDEEFKAEIRSRSERGLKLSVLLQQVRGDADLTLEEAEIEAELDRQSAQYPEAQRDQFKTWMRSQQEQLASLKDALLERRCIEHIVAQAKTDTVTKSLSAWQEEQEA